MRKVLLVVGFFCLPVSVSMINGRSDSRAEEAAPRYAITKIADSSNQKSDLISARGINDKGEVVGSADGGTVLWQNGKLTFLGELPGMAGCGATDLNDAGQIVGTCSSGTWSDKYFFWENGRMQDLGSAPFILKTIAINQRGEVMLHAESKKETYAALWHNGHQKSLGNWWPWALNDKGEVAGARIILGAVNDKGRPKEPDKMWAVIWQNGEAVSAGKDGSMAVLLNNNHDIVTIEEDRSVSPNLKRMFLVSGRKRIQLGQFQAGKDEDFIYPAAMNGHCQIVGHKFNRTGAVLWYKNQWHKLNDLIPAKSGWVLETAEDINNGGQIVGTGKLNGKSRAFLLTPIF